MLSADMLALDEHLFPREHLAHGVNTLCEVWICRDIMFRGANARVGGLADGWIYVVGANSASISSLKSTFAWCEHTV